MRRHTWTASQGTHMETRQEYINRLKRTLVEQCVEAKKGEHLNIWKLFQEVDFDLHRHGYTWLSDNEKMDIVHILYGCNFTNNEDPFEFWK